MSRGSFSNHEKRHSNDHGYREAPSECGETLAREAASRPGQLDRYSPANDFRCAGDPGAENFPCAAPRPAGSTQVVSPPAPLADLRMRL